MQYLQWVQLFNIAQGILFIYHLKVLLQFWKVVDFSWVNVKPKCMGHNCAVLQEPTYEGIAGNIFQLHQSIDLQEKIADMKVNSKFSHSTYSVSQK